MKHRFFYSLFFAMLLAIPGLAQNAAPDTTKTMPKLEIPEITIVGKKAITLPFARKGEIYDLNLYKAPPPDSSLLGERLETAMPTGFMPRDDEKRLPFHASAEGSFGSFSTGTIRAYLDYIKDRWKFSGNAGFASTEGHVSNANASSFNLGAHAQTLFTTDNDVLKTLQLSLGTKLSTDTYGMFAFSNVERSRQHFSLDASLASLDRRGISIDLGIGTNFWTVTDTYPPLDFEASVVSPVLTSAFALNVGKVRWSTDILFSSVSLDYSFPTQSVTLFRVTSSARWNLSEPWTASAGIVFANGSDILGATRTLVMPITTLEWKINEGQQFKFWWQPDMQLHTYDHWTRLNPYLAREIGLQPERIPINIGANFTIKQQSYTLTAGFSFAQYTNKTIIIPRSYPILSTQDYILTPAYVEATQTRFELEGTFHPAEMLRIKFSGNIQPTYESGSSEQLPMTPLFILNAKAEYDLPKPVTLWAAIDYKSEQNIDRFATESLDGAFLLNMGAHTTLVPRTLISASIHNLLGTSYYWWVKYPAPRLQFLLEAKVYLR